MTKKTYRTAQGKTVDLGALMLQNENTRAVGNMKVNARGDLIDGWNRPIDRRTQQVKKQYDKQVSNVSDSPVVSSMPTDAYKTRVPKESRASKATDRIDAEAAKTVLSEAPVVVPPAAESQGLAAAIARAKAIRTEPITPSNQDQGPKRI